MTEIKKCTDVAADIHQYAYRKSRSTADAIATLVHTALTHLDKKNSYVRLLFLDFSSAFNTIIPQTLIEKLALLGLNNNMCNWILDFLTNRPQSVRIHNITSSTICLNTGSPQGCVLSPLLYTLLTHDCAAHYSSNQIVKFADDTAVVGLIHNNDEAAYRSEVSQLESWCRTNNLSINVKKTKEMIVDFRLKPCTFSSLYINGEPVERVPCFKYLGVEISDNLTKPPEKGPPTPIFSRRLKKAGMGPPVLTAFYRCAVESILTFNITVWYSRKKLCRGL